MESGSLRPCGNVFHESLRFRLGGCSNCGACEEEVKQRQIRRRKKKNALPWRQTHRRALVPYHLYINICGVNVRVRAQIVGPPQSVGTRVAFEKIYVLKPNGRCRYLLLGCHGKKKSIFVSFLLGMTLRSFSASQRLKLIIETDNALSPNCHYKFQTASLENVNWSTYTEVICDSKTANCIRRHHWRRRRDESVWSSQLCFLSASLFLNLKRCFYFKLRFLSGLS